jgi:hypothetical protein
MEDITGEYYLGPIQVHQTNTTERIGPFVRLFNFHRLDGIYRLDGADEMYVNFCRLGWPT